jgi:tetratricopeptide (TPR) repeat protein
MVKSMDYPQQAIKPVQQALIAARNQDWNEALEILRSTNHMDLDPAERAMVLKVRASALTRRGEWMAARDDYLRLRRLYPASVELQLEVLLGLSDCYGALGDWSTASHLMESACEQLSDVDGALELRVLSMNLHVFAHFDAPSAQEQFTELLARTWPQGSELAVARFWQGECAWQLGDYDAAEQAYDLAHELAQTYGAMGTAADCVRRRTLLQLMRDDREWIYGVRELGEAAQWYEKLGDRSGGYTYTELGEVHKHLGHMVKAEQAFERGQTLMRHAHEHVRAAHNHLGMADVHRLQGRTQVALEQCDRARVLYRRLQHPWGMAWATYLSALLGDPWPAEDEWRSAPWYERMAPPERALVSQPPSHGAAEPLTLRYVD